MKPIGHSVLERLQSRMIERHDGLTLPRAPMAAVAAMCDVGRRYLYRVLAGRKVMSEGLRSRIEAVLDALDSGELRFRRVGWKWEAEYHTPPNPLPPPQDRMTRAADFVEWARCRSCGGSRFSLVTLHGAPAHWYLCDGCMWWETAGLGAKPVKLARRK